MVWDAYKTRSSCMETLLQASISSKVLGSKLWSLSFKMWHLQLKMLFPKFFSILFPCARNKYNWMKEKDFYQLLFLSLFMQYICTTSPRNGKAHKNQRRWIQMQESRTVYAFWKRKNARIYAEAIGTVCVNITFYVCNTQVQKIAIYLLSWTSKTLLWM